MLSDRRVEKVYLACGVTDMRKSIDSLAAIVQAGFGLDPFSPALFVFCNRGRDKLKILQWDHNGFWLHYRRLEKGTFRWPPSTTPLQTEAIDYRAFRWLLDGLDLQQKKAHSPLKPTVAI
jgi:transposase